MASNRKSTIHSQRTNCISSSQVEKLHCLSNSRLSLEVDFVLHLSQEEQQEGEEEEQEEQEEPSPKSIKTSTHAKLSKVFKA